MYVYLTNVTVQSNQFSVTENFRPATASTGRSLPGVFFYYDLSPIKVWIRSRMEVWRYIAVWVFEDMAGHQQDVNSCITCSMRGVHALQHFNPSAPVCPSLTPSLLCHNWWLPVTPSVCPPSPLQVRIAETQHSFLPHPSLTPALPPPGMQVRMAETQHSFLPHPSLAAPPQPTPPRSPTPSLTPVFPSAHVHS